MNKRLTAAGLAMAASFCLSSASRAETFESGVERVSLIELYTSEGCSSCPPAERWLAGLRSETGLWKEFVPVAFHVNYWDHLGWKDRFAQPEFTERQKLYADAWGQRGVYTPAVAIDGKESKAGARTTARERDFVGNLRVESLPDGSVFVQFAPEGSPWRSGYDVCVAHLAGGVSSQVRSGENAGRELTHEFVVTRLERVALIRGNGGQWTYSLPAPRKSPPPSPRTAVAAWIVRRGETVPFQATGGWLDPRGR